LFVLAGTCRHSYDGQWIDLRPASLIRIPAGVRHNLVNTGEGTLTCLVAFSSGARETVFLE
jgi:quercetin dioxygenase-like cupin family protein